MFQVTVKVTSTQLRHPFSGIFSTKTRLKNIHVFQSCYQHNLQHHFLELGCHIFLCGFEIHHHTTESISNILTISQIPHTLVLRFMKAEKRFIYTLLYTVLFGKIFCICFPTVSQVYLNNYT